MAAVMAALTKVQGSVPSGSQPSATPVPDILMPLLAFMDTAYTHTVHKQTCMQTYVEKARLIP